MTERAKRTPAMVRYIPFLVLLFFLALAFMYRQGLEARAAVGEAAPEFALERLNGGEIALSDLRGRPVVVNFWTTWCVECRTEAPQLEAFYRRYSDRVAVLGVDMREPEGVIRPFVDEHGLTYPILLDRTQKIARAYRVTGVPETWIVDAQGIARYHHVGPIDTESLEGALRSLGVIGGERGREAGGTST